MTSSSLKKNISIYKIFFPEVAHDFKNLLWHLGEKRGEWVPPCSGGRKGRDGLKEGRRPSITGTNKISGQEHFRRFIVVLLRFSVLPPPPCVSPLPPSFSLSHIHFEKNPPPFCPELPTTEWLGSSCFLGQYVDNMGHFAINKNFQRFFFPFF